MTGTLGGTEGKPGGQRTRTWPTLATYSLVPWNAKPLRVSRIDWRPCLVRNLGCPTRGPLRLPFRESNLIGAMAFGEGIVVDHPGAPKRPGESLMLSRGRVDAVAVPDEHATEPNWSMRHADSPEHPGFLVILRRFGRWRSRSAFLRGVGDQDPERGAAAWPLLHPGLAPVQLGEAGDQGQPDADPGRVGRGGGALAERLEDAVAQLGRDAGAGVL